MTVSAQNPAVPPESQPPSARLDLHALLKKTHRETMWRIEDSERFWFNKHRSAQAMDAYRESLGLAGAEPVMDLLDCVYKGQHMGVITWAFRGACAWCDDGRVTVTGGGKSRELDCEVCDGTGEDDGDGDTFQTTPDCTQVILPPPETWQRALDEFSGVRAPWS